MPYIVNGIKNGMGLRVPTLPSSQVLKRRVEFCVWLPSKGSMTMKVVSPSLHRSIVALSRPTRKNPHSHTNKTLLHCPNRPINILPCNSKSPLVRPCSTITTTNTMTFPFPFPFPPNNNINSNNNYNTTTTSTSTRKRLYNNNNNNNTNNTNANTFSIEERVCDPSHSHSPPQSSINNKMGENNDNNDDNKQNGVVSNNEKQEVQSSTKLLTLPTMLTLARVAAIPVFIATYYVNNWWGAAATTSIFVAAAITDWLDGYLARKMGLGTAFGAFLDPVADKLMVAATLVLLCSRPPVTGVLGDPLWLFPLPAMAIIGREITMSAVREWAASQNAKLLQAVAVNNLGKWKTATQMTALTILLATRYGSLAGPGPFATFGVALLYVSAGLAVWSLVVYMRNIWKVLLR